MYTVNVQQIISLVYLFVQINVAMFINHNVMRSRR